MRYGSVNRHYLNPRAPAHRIDGILLASAGAIAFSGKAIIVKLAYRYGVDAVTLIMYRMLFALPLFPRDGMVGGARPGSPHGS